MNLRFRYVLPLLVFGVLVVYLLRAFGFGVVGERMGLCLPTSPWAPWVS